jgi:thymidylate synthase (FAD)
VPAHVNAKKKSLLMEYSVLDKGFIRLVDFLGGDMAVVQSARVSFGQGSKGGEKDRKLIHYLMKHQHHTPFEHAIFKFHVKCPIFVARQWFRHRWSSFNEISGRYTEFEYEFFKPEIWRGQGEKGYEYYDLKPEETEDLSRRLDALYEQMFSLYEELLKRGVAKEQARIVLPLSLYTQFYWTVNARSLINFLKLRTTEHAQHEIRLYARKILDIFEEKMPWSYEAFLAYEMPAKQPAP